MKDHQDKIEKEIKPKTLSYVLVHQWLRAHYGNPPKCEHCGATGLQRKDGRCAIQWALKNGKEYARNRKNYLGLCQSCHHRYDRKRDFLKGKIWYPIRPRAVCEYSTCTNLQKYLETTKSNFQPKGTKRYDRWCSKHASKASRTQILNNLQALLKQQV